jgi:hypothetical protein
MRRRGATPFRGLLRWHHLAGLGAAVLIANWIVSGWLSVDRGLFFSSQVATAEQLRALRGVSLRAAAGQVPELASSGLGLVKEIEIGALAGRATLILRDTGPDFPRVIQVGALASARPGVLPDALLISGAEAAWSPARVVRAERVASTDRYARRGQPFPLHTRRLVLNDASETWVHIDAATGEVVSVMDAGRRIYRWCVDGLHNLDFPLLNRGGAWHVLLVTATTAGFTFAVTGIVLAVRRMRRNLAPRRA